MISAVALKTWRDLWIHKKQSIAVIAAIAVSTITLAVILISYAILSRAIDDNYQRSAPTMITWQLKELISPAIKSQISKRKDIGRVELCRVMSGNITNHKGETYPLILFLVRDFNDFQLDIVDLVQGHWPVQSGQIAIEQQALSVLQGSLGEDVGISTSAGLSGKAEIVAIAHDVSVAQAEWENIVYGYIDTDTLQMLGGRPDLIKSKLRSGTQTQQLKTSGCRATGSVNG